MGFTWAATDKLPHAVLAASDSFLHHRSGLPSRARKKDSEPAPLSFARLRGHRTSMGLRNALHDRRAQAGAAPTLVGLPVRLEDVRQGIGWECHPRVYSESHTH